MNMRRWLWVSAWLWVVHESSAQSVVVIGSEGVPGASERCADALGSRGFTARWEAEWPVDFEGISVVVALGTVDPGTKLRDWVRSGGLLITNFNSAFWAESYLGAESADFYEVASESVRLTEQGVDRRLGADTVTAINNPATPEFMGTFETAGSGEVWAVRENGAPIVIGGGLGLGEVVLVGYDWADVNGRFETAAVEGAALTSIGATAVSAGEGPGMDPDIVFVSNMIRHSPAHLVASIPEPSAYGALVASAAAGMAAWRRRMWRSRW